jgi:hypothetical protein
VADTGIAGVTVGSAPRQPIGRARTTSTSLRLDVAGDLTTPDSTDGRRLGFSLRLRNGAIDGAVTTRPPPASMLDGRVSYWMELRRSP